MQSNETILIALVIVLIAVLAYQSRNKIYRVAGRYDGFAGDPGGAYSIRTEANNRIQARAEERNGYRSHDIGDLTEFYRRGYNVTPEILSEAERSSWYSASPHNAIRDYDIAKSSHPGEDLVQYHQPGPAIDYQNHLTDIILDPRTKANHDKWAKEVMPFSQTAMVVDDMDEAVYMNTRNGMGITSFRNDTPAQGANTLFLTEADPHLHASHTTSLRIGANAM